MAANSFSTSALARAEVGSSRIRTLGSWLSALQISTTCRCHMGRCMILDLGLILTSITFSRRSVSDCTSFQLMRPPGFFGSRPMKIFSITVSVGTRLVS